MNITSVFFGVILGFLASVLGSVLMWLIVGNYIVGRRIENFFTGLGDGEYDEIIEMLTIRGFSALMSNETIRPKIANALNAYATNFSKWAGDRLNENIKGILESYGLSPEKVKEYTQGGAPGEALNINALLFKVADKFLGD